MSSGYNQYDPQLVQRVMSDAPKFNPAQMQQQRRFINDIDMPGINTPLPNGVEERIRQLQKMRGLPNPPPGQGPRQVAPDPQPEPERTLRSVLRRDNMG